MPRNDIPMETPAVVVAAEKKRPLQTETEVLSEAERDEQALARLGKKPILKVCDNEPCHD